MSYLEGLPDMGFRRKRRGRDGDGEQVIVYPKFTCRECGGDCPVYKTQGRVRYHKCNDCGHTFKSVETIVKG